jgi:transposase
MSSGKQPDPASRHASLGCGRQRGIDAEADRLATILRQNAWLRQPTLVEQAMGHRALALVRQLDAACAGEQDLARVAEETFTQHPDAEIITSFPGIGNLTGARIIGEIGDDRSRFADARALKAYAGSAPVTRAEPGSTPRRPSEA